MAQPPPIYLTILRKGDVNIIDLAEVGVLIPRSETRMDDAFLQELSAEILTVATPGYDQGAGLATVQELQRLGGVLFSQLLTETARKRLRTAEACDLYLRVDEQLVQVPWELCYDGEQFLATKFRLGRQVITSTPLPSPRAVPRAPGPVRVLLIADPTETLPQAGAEAEQLCALLAEMSEVTVTLLGGREVRRAPLLAAVQAHDVVHFAGHSYYDAQTPSHSGWVLHEGVLTAGELGKLSQPPLLVFSNSCQTGVTAAWQGDARSEGQAFGIGSAFLLAGVKNYVGTLWVVPDEESTIFATAFYRSLIAGGSLGEALRTARQEIISQRGWQNLTWANYLLYGDPVCTFLSATHTQSLPPGSFDRAQDGPLPQGEEKPQRLTQGLKDPRVGRARHFRTVLSAVSLLVIVAGVVALLFRSSFISHQSSLVTSEALPLPDKPSIAVLPFTNMSGDPGQEYFSDGLTETLITDLSKLSGLFVIARHSVFTYKGQAVKVEQISQELGVRYVLEGSVQKADDRVRINVQFVDGATGGHLWAERYDRPFANLFTLQDELIREVVTALHVEMLEAELKRVQRAPSGNLTAYDFVLRGLAALNRVSYENSQAANAQARQSFEKALSLDPTYAEAHAWLGVTYFNDWLFFWNFTPETLERAATLAQQAVSLDNSLPLPHLTLGGISLWQKNHEQGIAEIKQAITLDPNWADAYVQLGWALGLVGRPEEGIEVITKAMRLNPRYPDWYLLYLADGYRNAERCEEVLPLLQKVVVRNPDFGPAHVNLAVCYAHLGRQWEAEVEMAKLLRLWPTWSLEIERQAIPYKNSADLERYLDGLRKAGLK